MKSQLLILGSCALFACAASGCATATPPAQQALQSRRIFNAALETIHGLHAAGKISAQQERQLLPVIVAASAALDRMDLDALSGNPAGFDVAARALDAALSELDVTISQAQMPSRPSSAPGTRPSGANED
jgi:hypothetical protein